MSPLAPRSIATITMPGDIIAKLAAAEHAGYDGVEICQGDVDGSGLAAAAIGATARDLGLAVYAWQPLHGCVGVQPDVFPGRLHDARRLLPLARDLGTDLVIACSAFEADAVDDEALAADQLGRLADLLAPAGIRVAFEAMSFAPHIRTAQQAVRLAAKAERPNLGVCLDAFHLLMLREDLGLIGDIPAGNIYAVQVCDAVRWPGMDLRDIARRRRCLPLAGELDVAGFARAVASARTSGVPWSLEVFSERLWRRSPDRVAAAGMQSLDHLGAEIPTR